MCVAIRDNTWDRLPRDGQYDLTDSSKRDIEEIKVKREQKVRITERSALL